MVILDRRGDFLAIVAAASTACAAAGGIPAQGGVAAVPFTKAPRRCWKYGTGLTAATGGPPSRRRRTRPLWPHRPSPLPPNHRGRIVSPASPRPNPSRPGRLRRHRSSPPGRVVAGIRFVRNSSRSQATRSPSNSIVSIRQAFECRNRPGSSSGSRRSAGSFSRAENPPYYRLVEESWPPLSVRFEDSSSTSGGRTPNSTPMIPGPP